MSRRIGWLCLLVALLCCISVAGAGTEITIDDSVISQRDYPTSNIYADLFDLDILTDESAARRQQAEARQEEARKALLGSLDLSYKGDRPSVKEQMQEQMKTLPLFETVKNYRLDETKSDTDSPSFYTLWVVLIFVALCVLSFFAALGWRQYRKGREQHADNHEFSVGR